MMSRRNVVQAIDRGIESANKTYEKWSNGLWLNDSGIESLLVVKIAETIIQDKALNLVKGESLRLETLFRDIEENSKADRRRGRKLNILGGNGRVDITLWRKDETVAAAIEVKRRWDKLKCRKDLERLAALICEYGRPRSGKIEFGVLAVFVAEKNEEKAQKKYDTIRTYCKSLTLKDIDMQLDELPTRTFGTLRDLHDLRNQWWAAWTCGGITITLTTRI